MTGIKVSAPIVAESPANLECRVVQVIDIGGAGASYMVMGEVIALHIREDVLDGTGINNDALRAIGRMAGNTYINTRDRFELERP
jgi:flavin reductase (DIM6/NTAB) family NADH-FMN oxidoreductase RutF